MVSYKPVLHPSAEEELNKLPNSQRQELTTILKDVAATRQPTMHSHVKHLEGQDNKFRVRSGDIRAVCELCKPRLEILAVGKREKIYQDIDATLESRS